MKNLFLLSFVMMTHCSFAQFNSYMDSKSEIDLIFKTSFLQQRSSDVENIFILSAKDGFEISLQLGQLKRLSTTLNYAFTQADCENCEQVSEKRTSNPIDYIFDVIEYQDVFLVTEFENQYKVIRYQPVEE